MAKFLSIQGTSSDSGKSFLTMALCRIFADEGYKVAPFKAQNMSSNADIVDGLEMARAQSIQAMAARIKPDVRMNPILLKPMGNYTSKVVLLGKEYATMHAKEYYNNFLSNAFNHVLDAIKELGDMYDIIIIEGAGSAIEINLKEDIANMKLAKKVNANVIITADIDRGGAFASMLGTLALLDEEERSLVKGFIINRFRGDIDILKPAINQFEELSKKDILGVIPYINDIKIAEEDTLSLKDRIRNNRLTAIVIKYPNSSSLREIEPLISNTNIIYANRVINLEEADIIILPPTRDLRTDLRWLKDNGLADGIRYANKLGKKIIGIREGYLMLLDDIEGIEGLRLLNGKFRGRKMINDYVFINGEKCFIDDEFIIDSKDERLVAGDVTIGLISKDKRVIGYNANNAIRSIVKIIQDIRIEDMLDEEIDRIARIVKDNIRMDKLEKYMGLD